MVNFTKSAINNQLYVALNEGEDSGFAAFLLKNPPPSGVSDSFTIAEALTGEGKDLNGSFILSAFTPDITNDFVNKLFGLLGTGRYIIWILDISNFSFNQNTLITFIAGDGSSFIQAFTIDLVTGISFQIQAGMKLTAKEDTIELGSSSGTSRIQIIPTQPPNNVSNTLSGSLQLSGSCKGCLSFSMVINRDLLANGFSWGFQMLIPVEHSNIRDEIAEYLPLASNSPSQDNLGFDITIDPSDLFNIAIDRPEDATLQSQYASRRSFFDFTGTNQNSTETILNSYYFTTWGANFQLVPAGIGTDGLRARLVLNNGESITKGGSTTQVNHLAPEGDFMILVNGATTGSVYSLQCGLQGTEFFNVQSRVGNTPGDTMRFIANQPAFAPVYPLPVSSPLTAPVDPDTQLLNNQFHSSWCTLINAPGHQISYVGQPKGAALFGGTGSVIGHSTPNFNFTADDIVLFPILPYTEVVPDAMGPGNSFSQEQIENFERLFISTTRKKNINSILVASHQQAQMDLKNTKTADQTPYNVATPSGLIAGLSGSNDNPVWKNIYLAQNQNASGVTQMRFENPDSELVQAFQTSDLFLVIANNKKLGEDAFQGAFADEPAKFYNKMFIGDWSMQVNTGTENKYNDYNNIIIVKGRKGKLYDPANPDNSLVNNWQKWTAKETFAAPTYLVPTDTTPKLEGPDQSQLVILSQWLQTYFEDASQQTDQAYFGNFNAIANDENWTGILILRMNISSLPDNLAGILSGVRFPADFRAHHFGINITPVKNEGPNGPDVTSPNSMFGLIYYNDPDFNKLANPLEPIDPNPEKTYDFILLNLQVLFENTSVKKFQSYAQLTTNNYFGSSVDHMGVGGNTFNTMILKGALQFQGSTAIYSLATDGVNTFYFDSQVINKVEVTNANFSTLGTNDNNDLVSWFSINGYWDFKKLTSTNEDNVTTDFDLFSFGNDTGQDEQRKGLIFNGLGIQMIAEPYVPGSTEPVEKTLTFDTSRMTFDQGRSTPRLNSIYVNFALNLQNLVQGTSDTSPSGNDYLTVITDLKVTPIDGSPWLGLSYKLNMGTPGELAGNVGLTATLLTAWNPSATDSDSAPAVLVGIKLPGTGGGAKLISLQSVLKLSIGQIRLSYAENEKSFLMMFTDIALKFLMFLKLPPNGSVLFYLFGNPQSGGKASGLGWYAMYNQDKKEEEEESKTTLIK